MSGAPRPVRPRLSSAVLVAVLAPLLLAAPRAASAVILPQDIAVSAPSDERVDLTALRETYLRSVRESKAIREGLAEIERLRGTGAVRQGSELDATLTAYRGALVTLRAKHAFWPTQKLQYLNQGLAVLDATVGAHPDHAEARYLRLMSCYYLPGVLGRGRTVRDDFGALARLLPGVRRQYPAELYGAITRFVVERGRLPADQARALEATLAQGDA